MGYSRYKEVITHFYSISIFKGNISPDEAGELYSVVRSYTGLWLPQRVVTFPVN
jgi:hypothetical protein